MRGHKSFVLQAIVAPVTSRCACAHGHARAQRRTYYTGRSFSFLRFARPSGARLTTSAYSRALASRNGALAERTPRCKKYVRRAFHNFIRRGFSFRRIFFSGFRERESRKRALTHTVPDPFVSPVISLDNSEGKEISRGMCGAICSRATEYRVSSREMRAGSLPLTHSSDAARLRPRW